MKRYILSAAVALTAAGMALAADSYDSVIGQVVSNNSRLKSIVADNESRLRQLRSENNLEDPEVEFEHVWGKDGVGNKWGIGVSQTFDFPGLYKARGNAAGATGRALDSFYANEVMTVMLDAKVALIDLAYYRRMEKMLNEIFQNMKELRDNTRNAFLKGEGTILDVNKTEIELVKIEQRLSECKRDMEDARQQLVALGASVSDFDGVDFYPADGLMSEADYLGMAERDPMLAYYTNLSETERLNARAVSLSNIPKLSVGYRHDYELGEVFNGFTVGVTLPFFSNRNKKAAATSAAAAADFNRAASSIEIETSMRAAYRNVLNLKDLVDGLAPVFEQTDHPRLLYKALKGGEINILTYIQEMVYFIDAETDYQSALHDYHSQLARLNRYQLLLKTPID